MPLSPPQPRLRPMRAADLEGVLAVQAQCYPAPMQEPGAVVAARLLAAPDSVLVAGDAAGVCAYLFAYPSLLGKVTALGAPFALAAAPDTLYLHDLAVAPRAHGRGLGRRLVQAILAAGAQQGLAHSALVSVQASRPFWESFGYMAAPEQGAAALDGYGDGALYMTRLL
jgi:ribosomal protein S18 acetylase RimI-like enzyme